MAANFMNALKNEKYAQESLPIFIFNHKALETVPSITQIPSLHLR